MARLRVFQYFDETNQSLVHRIPEQGSAAIQMGAQLIVAENQEAVFFRDGKAMDSFQPGRHTLTTQNIPFITRILTIPWEKSPFQAQIYFFGKQTFLDQKWGTRQPIVFRDKEFGMVRLRSFGKYSFRCVDAPLLLNTLVGSQGKYTTEEVTAFLKDLVVSRLTDLLGTLGSSILDLPAKYDEIGGGTRAKVAEDFAKYGLELVDFFINAITPPEEVQKAIDTRTSMGAVGDLNAFMKFQAANSMMKMAEKGGGGGGGADAMGMGMGAGFGFMMPGMIHNAMMAGQQPMMPGQQPMMPGQAGTVPPQAAPPATAAPAAAAAAGAGAAMDFGDLSAAAAAPVDSKAVVRGVIEAAGYAMTESGDTWAVTVPIGTLRKQHVTVGFGTKDDAGHEVITFRSTCGKATPQNAVALLRYNTKLLHGSFAYETVGGQELVVLQANQLAETLDPLEVSRVLTAIAWQADKVEEKLGGEDEH